jgi:uncharacterized protein
VKLRNEFTVAAPLDRTWETLLDVERVAGCLPGAAIEPAGEDGMYRGSMRIKVGPVSMSYSGTVRLADLDAHEHVASFDARAKETRGSGTAAAVIRNRLEPAPEGTHVVVETDLNITGRAAQFGRGLMEDVAARMLSDFAGRLEQLVLAGTPEAEAAAGFAAPAPEPAVAAQPVADEEPSLDLGRVLIRGYGRHLAVAAGLLLALLAVAVLARRRSRTVIVRFRL